MDSLWGLKKELITVDYARKFFYFVPNVPRQVNIEATNKCNLNCKMCKRRELNIPETGIELTKFIEIIDKLPASVQEISFGSYGESFIHPDIYKMIQYVKLKEKIVSITTNGFVFIDGHQRKKLLETGMNNLRVSIEEISPGENKAHPYSSKLLSMLESLAKERTAAGSKMKLFFNTVVHTGNYDQIVPLIEYAEKIGFDQVELIHLDKKSNDVCEYLPTEKEIALYKKIKKMKFKIPVSSLYDRYLGIRKFAFRHMEYCPFTYDVCHITIDGDVTPCCFGLPRHKIDNIFERPLEEIWNGQGFKQFRKNQREVCRGCTLMRFE